MCIRNIYLHTGNSAFWFMDRLLNTRVFFIAFYHVCVLFWVVDSGIRLNCHIIGAVV